METVTTELVSRLIEQAQKNGKSDLVELEEDSIGYFRMLLSKYNSKNGTKIIVRRVQSLNWEVRAPFDRFFDQQAWKPAFDLIQKVLCDPDFKLSESEFLIIQEKIHSIENLSMQRLLAQQGSASNGKGRDILK